MRRLYNLSLVVCGMVLLSATSGVDFVQAEPERGEPQYGGTVNILTHHASLNALSFNQYAVSYTHLRAHETLS